MKKTIKQETFEKIFKEHLKVETYSISILSLFNPRLKNKIDYKPYYQRNYVWDYSKATHFIESILLGTEIPPLIFFKNKQGIEIIDGRQRYESVLRFMDDRFALNRKGLSLLTSLKNLTYSELAKNDIEIIDKFLDAKIRIIEFNLVNEPPLDRFLEDRVKKEIFSRYNSGITPLRKSEIENAVYNEDGLSNEFKSYLTNNSEFASIFYKTFFAIREQEAQNPSIDKIMAFIRANLVLPMIPIMYYARSSMRLELISRLYEKYSDDNIENERNILMNFIKKVNFIIKINEYSNTNKLKNNRLALACFLWSLGVLELEELQIDLNDDLIQQIALYINENIEQYTDIDYGFNKEVNTRYSCTSKFIEQKYKIDASIYIQASDLKRSEIKDVLKPNNTSNKISELDTLRLNKPEPSRINIDDVMRMMTKRRFLVRPSYQRQEVINQSKASSIIESILLGITLPAIFIYKRSDGVSEVIDGQQRLLTLLGYIGHEYIDETGKSQNSKNYRFALRKLKILDELDGCKFNALSEEQQNKIYDFPLYIVEIDQTLNPQFNPIDLFIRLNDKPYPIRDNSFEMWNSWVDVDVIQQIKKIKESLIEWFYVKQVLGNNDRDRMENEELITSLVYLEYTNSITNKEARRKLDIYQKTNRLNARIAIKSQITNFLMDITENVESKKNDFNLAIKSAKGFIKKLKLILLDKHVSKNELNEYLKAELDTVLKAGNNPRYYRRTFQDFYFLWFILNDINYEMVKEHRIEIKNQIKDLLIYAKNIPLEDSLQNKGMERFEKLVTDFKQQYQIEKRSIRLTEEQKHEMIMKQNERSGISGYQIFLGDDIEVDHVIPLAKQGEDNIGNLSIVHKDENRKKGARSK
ncbi:MAG: DUF262 domain-containing protein [Bacteriodetes bacterium]|nr:DUF262 domain-containing protein [Bacteroidota bacterium]